MFAGPLVPAFPEAPPVGVAVELTQDHIDVDFAAPNGLFEATGEFLKAGNSFADLSKVLGLLNVSGLGPPFLN